MIPFIDLKSQYNLLKDKIDQRIHTVLDHGMYIMGPEVEELENNLAFYTGSKYCVSNSSGTDSLLIALMALGIKRGDEVIVPDFSFFATAEVVELLGAESVFVDVEPTTGNMDVKDLLSKITSKTKAIMPVSLYGQCADFDEINKIAENHNIPVIEDAAQSFGASYKNKKSCNLTTIGATSFFPSKPLGGYGDGGACFTNDEELAQKMKRIRTHGQSKRYVHTDLGLNGRLDTLQAAILIEKLKVLDKETELRQQVASRYFKGLTSKIIKPIIKPHNKSVFAQFTIQVTDRENLIKFLEKEGVPTSVHYPIVLSSQPLFNGKNKSVNLVANKLSNQVLSIPFSPYLKESDQEIVISAINRFYN